MARRTLVRTAAVLGAASLALAGCSSDKSDDSSSSGSTSGASAATTSVTTDCTPEQAKAGATPSTEALRIGTLLPDTGSLSFLGPPMVAGTQLGVNDVNAAGGVLGQPVQLIPGDSGDTTTDTANTTVDRELAAGTQVIVGAASSSVSLKVIDKIASAGVVMFSPANTSDQFVCYPDKGMYFRTAPTDVLQAQAVAQLISDDGGQRVAIMALNDPYGTGLADNIEKNLIDSGVPSDQIEKIIYDPNAQSFNSEVDQVKNFNPDAVALVGFEESAKIITRMHEVGIGPSDGMAMYGVDGNMGNALGESVAKPLLDTMQGTTPLTDVGAAFQDRLKAVNPSLIDFNYAGESYDAVVISALAAEQAKSTAGTDIAANINSVTEGGTKCTSYVECLPLVKAGTDIDYDGITGELDFNDSGEPSIGSYGKLKFGPENTLTTEGFVVVGK
ncbi:ABC transporter substrate-binding protein [Rhodococcus qingshengii]|jgi:neutral amino acid transport system substrate-binding protein|uniref:ABC transporter substrate-binding protein n=5 Tax=Rhodococcus erythropolis group TaxID=2840174 RepID=A0A0E4A7I8_RHOER|nr:MULTISPECIES: ABC transporter substrate-binding protein [Rhodococcus]EEN86176.1 receptor family ligand-binding protein [Rhodococcus erythropolis SK121]MCD2156991.1 ABC transporter substrate-binding protein [Rhodococcus cerastii]NHE68749.1 ABC transporter substrate-binding protein [Rhodococcus sp. D-46]NHP16756.1 ABC transporter substrate-binding protein [Rhodococcus sp. IC4_135]AGT92923.1 ABC transporter substrate-binding protein [Rhodococcus erythropolis CCM2595]